MLGLYIHIPFCQSKCRYCGFNSRPDKSEFIPRYIDAILKQLDFLADKFALLKNPIDTVYFGGGTPSLLEPNEIGRILQAAKGKFSLKDDCEISIEANPNTITTEKASALRALGFNRVSLGAQSFDDTTLSFLGRLHKEKDITASFEILRASGFNNINLDLISAIPATKKAGRPGTTLDTWISSLDKTISLNPEHVSVYDFAFEKNSVFEVWRKEGKVKELGEDLEIQMLNAACDRLRRAGFIRYEISNYAKPCLAPPGVECRHNMIYWKGEEYIGIGAGAFSYLGGSRFAMDDSIEGFISAIEAGDFSFKYNDRLSDEKRFREKIAIGLRLTEGIELGTGLGLELGTDLKSILKTSLVELDGGRIRLTERGLLLYDEVAAKIV